MELRGVYVRSAVEADAEAICDVVHSAFTKYQQDLGQTGKVSALKENADDIRRDIRSKHVLIGMLDGRIIGSVRYEILPSAGGPVAYLSRFGVLGDYQGSGMGGILIKRVEDECRAQGARAIALHTSSRMTYLVCFYYRNGYFIHSTSTARGYIRALMVRELDAGDYDLSPVFAR